MTELPVLRRSPTDCIVAGVCGGLARSWNIDPVLLRIGFVILILATSGVGLFGYAFLWALVPKEGTDPPSLRSSGRAGSGRRRVPVWTLTLLALAALLVLAPTGLLPGALLVGVVFGAVWYAAARSPSVPRRPPSRAPVQPAQASPAGISGYRWEQPPFAHARVEAPVTRRGLPRATRDARRAALRTWLGVLAGCWAVWTLLAARAAAGAPPSGLAWLGGTLAVLALALVLVARPARAKLGRPALLLPVAFLLACATSLAMVLGPHHALVQPDPAIETFSVSADLPARQELSLGSHTLDLTGLRVTHNRTVSVTMDAGDLTVKLPADGNVRVNYVVRAGQVVLPGETHAGLDNAASYLHTASADDAVLTLDVSLNTGRLVMK